MACKFASESVSCRAAHAGMHNDMGHHTLQCLLKKKMTSSIFMFNKTCVCSENSGSAAAFDLPGQEMSATFAPGKKKTKNQSSF